MPVGLPRSGDPTAAVRDTVAALATPRIPGLPPLTGGLVGAISYDAVRRWERVPDAGRDELQLPELAMMLATDLAVFDHSDGSLLLVANAVNHDATDERIGVLPQLDHRLLAGERVRAVHAVARVGGVLALARRAHER